MPFNNRGSYDRETGMVTGSGGRSRMAGEKLQGLQNTIDDNRAAGGVNAPSIASRMEHDRAVVGSRSDRRERGKQLKQNRANRREARQGRMA
tara:strand:- start:68 stop:343 length:276 start_codon:yes stop_codon:yes gene_type:complete